VEIVVQINGRVKGRMLVEAGLGQQELLMRAKADPKIAQHLDGQRVVKTVVVPDKLVNLVVR
jgi:leucyl-tRNA synthetase